MSSIKLTDKQKSDLIVALLNMCSQYMGDVHNDKLCYHQCMSTGDGAMDILVELGYAKEIDGGHFEINYKDLGDD